MTEKSKRFTNVEKQPGESPESPPKRGIEYETYLVIPPDGGWAWVVVFGAFFSYFITDGLQYSFGIFLKDISITFKCEESKVSLAGAVNTCLFCFSGPFSAALINRFGYRKVSFSGSIIASISCVLTSFSNSIYMVIIFHGVIGGIGLGMIYLTAVIVVGFYFERWRALATGIAVCGAGFGAISLPPLFTVLMQQIGWRHTFQVLGCMCLCIIACSSVFRPIKPTKILVRMEPPVEREPGERPQRYKGAVTYNQIMDGKISTVTVLEPKKVTKEQSSEVLMNTVYPSNSAETSDRHDRGDAGRRCKCCDWMKCNCTRRHKKDVTYSRPLNKDDIFYSGSLVTLPEYKQSLHTDSKSRSNLEYQLSITRDSPPDPAEYETVKKSHCSVIMKHTLLKMLDYRLLSSGKFIILMFTCLFTSMGFYIPYLFIKNSAVQHGIDPNVAYWFISTMGLANIFGRIGSGLLSTIPGVRAIILVYCMLFVAGISTILSTFCNKLWMLFLYSAIYGFTIASISALKTVLIVDLLGLNKLTNAIGMILIFQGFATLIGVLISGYLRDISGDYRWSFYFGGCSISIAALFFFTMNMTECKCGK